MNKQLKSAFRTVMLPLTATVVTVGAFIGLPAMKALAATQERNIAPVRILPPVNRMNMLRPVKVNPNADRLVAISDQALADSALAERIYSDPDAVAAQHGLSEHEKLVLRHMTREQFDTARADAARVSADRLARPGSVRFPASMTDANLIAGRMVVGRAILAAVGRSYLEAANANACCPWGHAIELGVNPSRVFYDEVFKAPRANLIQPEVNLPRPN